jgi:SAM-dependent methyltransferase
MTECFGPVYAGLYDVMYREKPYEAECELIEEVLRDYGEGPVHRVVDLGCGTGSHAIPLTQRGYDVVGVDRSEPMLARARKKAAGLPNGEGPRFIEGDIRSFNLPQTFDAALMMFTVLGYQLENVDVRAVLHTTRRHLRVGGLVMFDSWYGPAVLRQRPEARDNVVSTPEGRVERRVTAQLDILRHRCTVDLHVRRVAEGGVVEEVEERHAVRYFFPLELGLFLECEGFTLLRIGAFPEIAREPDETTWNVVAVARAV